MRSGLVAGLVFAIGVSSSAAWAATTWRAQGALSHPDGLFAAASEEFGSCVAIHGDVAIVGAPTSMGPDGPTGAVFVFARMAGTWTFAERLAPGDLPAGARFGATCAMTDDRLVAGASGAETPPAAGGAAYVYARTNGSWIQEQKLVGGDAGAESFGSRVAIDSATIVVSAVRSGPPQRGSAYVFARSTTGWGSPQKLSASDSVGNVPDLFGWSVAVDDATLAIGDPLRGNPSIGGIYVYARVGATWTEKQALTASDAAYGDELGHSLALRGDTILSGARRRNHGAGAAYVFCRAAGTWNERQKLEPAVLASSDDFGATVSLLEDVLFVGAPGRHLAKGAVFVYRDLPAGWGAPAEFQAPPNYGFSRALAASGTTLVASSGGVAQAFRDSLARGAPCTSAAECVTDSCADGVCCDTACGGSDPRDCEACTKDRGAPEDGVCGAALPTVECRSAATECDVAERCDGVSRSCPANAVRTNGSACSAGGVCVNGACSIGASSAGAVPEASPSEDTSGCSCHIVKREDWPMRAIGLAALAALAVVASAVRRKTRREGQ